MKRIFLFSILVLSFLSLGLLYKEKLVATAKDILYYSPCDTPIHYSIGTIDKGFDITTQELQADAQKASDIWSTTQKKPLFQYDPDAKFTINMVYDSRQELTSKITKLNSNLKEQQGAIDPKIAQYKKAQAEFETRVNALNSKVTYWNTHGGAPREEYDALIAEQKSLQAEATTLNETAQSLGQSTNTYNLSARELNHTIGNYQNVLQDKPEEGLYEQNGTDRKISIYIDIEKDEFLHTLTHEMGHALDLNHNSNPRSIMNPQTNSVLVPSTEDIKDLDEICLERTIFEVAVNRIKEIVLILESRYKK